MKKTGIIAKSAREAYFYIAAVIISWKTTKKARGRNCAGLFKFNHHFLFFGNLVLFYFEP